ncbi:MAG: elongation factor P [Candidatus Pacebacteria bacterium]|nr:elongation factor P [Candidatus Paceibacterota bacterium]
MLGINDLKPKTVIIINDEPYEVLSTNFLKMQQRKPVLQTRLKNLINGKVIERNIQHSEEFEEAEIERLTVEFLYEHRGEYWFCEANDRSKRFQLDESVLGDNKNFLKSGVPIDAFKFNGRIINISLPIKMDFKVVEAPPGIKGDTAQGGTKVAIIETGAKVAVPLFINEGDIIRVNTESGEYVERVEKAKIQ